MVHDDDIHHCIWSLWEECTDGQTQKEDGIYPVSYTHLDVYKRQEVSKKKVRGAQPDSLASGAVPFLWICYH